MLYVAEVPVSDDDLDDRMNRMRAWLDHQRFEPSSFRLWRTADRQVVRVLFKIETRLRHSLPNSAVLCSPHPPPMPR